MKKDESEIVGAGEVRSAIDVVTDAAKDLLGIGDEARDAKKLETGPRVRRRSLEIIPLDRIDPRPGNRAVFSDHVLELSATIRRGGMNYNIMVRPHGADERGPRYQIVDGEHRYRAHVLLGLPAVACVVDHDMTDDEALDAGACANRLRWAPSLWDDFVEVLQRRAEPGSESVETVATRTCIDRAMVERMFSIQDNVTSELWPELERNPTWDTLVHLRACGRVSRRDTRETRRDKQISWWNAQRWNKRPDQKYLKRRPTRRAVLARVSRIDPEKVYLGRDVRKWMMWVLGERDEQAGSPPIADAAE